jgi:hypothetical protein
VKLDWIPARLAFSERDTEKLLRMIEHRFGAQVGRQINIKFLTPGGYARTVNTWNTFLGAIPGLGRRARLRR